MPTTTATVARLHRYPVKGLSAEPLASAPLSPGCGIPLDRAFALAYATMANPADGSTWMPKKNFVTLVRHERLAALDVRFEETNQVLSIHRGGKRVARGAVRTPVGRAMIEEFFRAYLKHELAGPTRFVGSIDGPMFSDHPQPTLSLIGLATIADVERVAGCPIDPLRFRANVYLQGTAPWEELGWVGRELRIGTARLRVVERILRCVATNVEPGTGIRDLSLPEDLKRGFGHADCGVLAVVTDAGTVALGDPVEPAPDA
jgi:uncharacterized protein